MTSMVLEYRYLMRVTRAETMKKMQNQISAKTFNR